MGSCLHPIAFSLLYILDINGKKMLIVPEDFFSRFTYKIIDVRISMTTLILFYKQQSN